MRSVPRIDNSAPMKSAFRGALLGCAILLTPIAAAAQSVDRGDRAILDVTRTLKPGQYVWDASTNVDGPALVIVNLETQKLVLFRNGVPVGASTVSSGAPGHETPTGVFTILQKNKDHRSKTYNNAPMPNMQRLTWKGIALHAGNLPGYPASHGCIRLPMKFSELLFKSTTLGMTVVITSMPAVPQISGEPLGAVAAPLQSSLDNADYSWNPTGSAYDPMSIVISAADQRAIVIKDGKEIGSAPVRMTEPLNGATAYVLRAWDDSGKHWLKLRFDGPGGSMEVAPEEAKRFDAPAGFRTALAAAIRPGSVVIVTPESLKAGSSGTSATVFEEDKSQQ
jgi:hypothetical protein